MGELDPMALDFSTHRDRAKSVGTTCGGNIGDMSIAEWGYRMYAKPTGDMSISEQKVAYV